MKRILLIDDDTDDAGLFKEALEEVAPLINFQYFDDGKEAVQKLTEEAVPIPDVILLDLNLPSVSGWECLAQLKTATHLITVPIIFYTTSSLAKEKEMAYNSGAAGFITKPNNFNLLKDFISILVGTPPEQLHHILRTI